MAMSKDGHIPGGGIASNKVVHTGYKTGAARERIVPAGVYQYGQAVGNHVTGAEGGGGDLGYHGINPFSGKAGYPSRLGNEVAATTQCGPGGSRNVYKSGQQQQTGPSAPGNPTPVSKEPLVGLGWKR